MLILLKYNPMEKLLGEFSFGLFIWQAAIVLALLLLLRKFAWKPILNTINEREAGIRSANNFSIGLYLSKTSSSLAATYQKLVFLLYSK